MAKKSILDRRTGKQRPKVLVEVPFVIFDGLRRQPCVLKTATDNLSAAMTFIKNHRRKIDYLARSKFEAGAMVDGVVFVDAGEC